MLTGLLKSIVNFLTSIIDIYARLVLLFLLRNKIVINPFVVKSQGSQMLPVNDFKLPPFRKEQDDRIGVQHSLFCLFWFFHNPPL